MNIQRNHALLRTESAVNRSPKIMVVDDSKVAHHVVREALTAHGYTVHSVENQIEFAHHLNKMAPDLVLMDLNMPGLSGADIISTIRSFKMHSCPIVLHSDRPLDELLAVAAACGADGVIRKTRDAARLVAEVDQFLGR